MKIRFIPHVLPHLVALAVFLLVTVFFFNPVFFDNKTLEQHDIQQFVGSSKAIADYREHTGDEALWTNSMFSGMPAYLISVQWGNTAISVTKKVMGLFLPHPYSNIFLAFLCYYILLLAFGVRPYLAIGGALAFGLSTYVIVGLTAGHNARIGAIAFMPLVMAGIHLTFSGRKILGAGLTAMALALELRENHLQITYYLVLIAAGYGIMRLIEAVRRKQLPAFLQTAGILMVVAFLSAGSFFGQFWAVTQYTQHTIRGTSDLARKGDDANASGLTKEYAFAYKYGILEPLTLLIPEFYGGSSATYFVSDKNSHTYNALVRAPDNNVANQLANFSSAYWGPQSYTSAPYYAGAIIIFLFMVGIALADRKYVWWLVPLSVLSILLSWGDSFASFNYFMFDYFPGYNKFRSVNFALIIILFAMPLLGMVGVEALWRTGASSPVRKKLWIALGATGGLCLIFLLIPGIFDFTRPFEEQLPPWFLDALADDRKSLLRSDAFRSLAFILSIFIVLYFDLHKKISPAGVYAFLILMITIDLAVVNKRYLKEENFKRKRENTFFAITEADREILKDTSYYRVYNLQNPFNEARTSYYHHSVGGYHGAKLKRYQDFLDSCVLPQTQQFVTRAQQGALDFKSFPSINMLNTRYLVFGPQAGNVIHNTEAAGNAWFVSRIKTVQSAEEELASTCALNPHTEAVIHAAEFKVPDLSTDSSGKIDLITHRPNYLKYKSQSTTGGLVVFSEIYYPEGWSATIDGTEAPILRANYILRALQVPSGDHTIEFSFEPRAYRVGNTITTASSWLVLLLFLGSVGWSLRQTSRQGEY